VDQANLLLRWLWFITPPGNSANGPGAAKRKGPSFQNPLRAITPMSHFTTSALPHQDRLRVLAVDSNSMSTQLLVEALARDAQFQMIEAPSTEGAILSVLKRQKPDIAVISARLGENGGKTFDLVREIRSQVPDTRVVVMIDASERGAVIEAFRSGATGVFCRTEPFRQLAKCIQCVRAGQVWASSRELHFLLDALAQPTFANFRTEDSIPLSAREVDVVRCVAEGLTNREIAERLKLTEHTVKNYLFRIFDKLGVSSRVEVVLYALGRVGNSSEHQSLHGVPIEPKPALGRRVTEPIVLRRTAT
jgi:two-component system, NarL family, nitrate/nitrite response regulator NarL